MLAMDIVQDNLIKHISFDLKVRCGTQYVKRSKKKKIHGYYVKTF